MLFPMPFVLHYPRMALTDWIEGKRDDWEFPIGKDFRYWNCVDYCHRKPGGQPTKYFAEAWTVRHFAIDGWRCWHERAQLENAPDDTFDRCANEIIFNLMGPNTFQKLRKATRRCAFKFKNPDVIAYFPKTARWLFLEAKLDFSDDEPHPGGEQELSLELLQSAVPNSQGIIVNVTANPTLNVFE